MYAYGLNTQDAAEKARTVDALQKKVSSVGRSSCTALFDAPDTKQPAAAAGGSRHASVRRSCHVLFGAASAGGAGSGTASVPSSAIPSRENSRTSVGLTRPPLHE